MNLQKTWSRGHLILLFILFVLVLITQRSWFSTEASAVETSNQNGNTPGANLPVDPEFEPYDGGDAVHLVMPSNKFDRPTCRSIFTHLANGFPPPRIVMHDLEADWSNFNTQKIPRYYDYLKTVKDGTIVILIDGGDVWTQLPLRTMLDRYKRLTENKAVLVSADKMCWPNPQDQPVCRDVPQSTLPDDVWGTETGRTHPQTRARWNNSGAIIGEASMLKKMFADLQKDLDARSQPPNTEQEIFNNVYAELWKNPDNSTPWHLDFESSIFQTLVHSERDISFQLNIDPRTEPSSETIKGYNRTLDLQGLDMKRVWKDRSLLWNQITNNIPVALHFNGWAKRLMVPFWKRMWFYKDGPKLMEKILSQPDKAGIWIDNQWKTFDVVCWQHMKQFWSD